MDKTMDTSRNYLEKQAGITSLVGIKKMDFSPFNIFLFLIPVSHSCCCRNPSQVQATVTLLHINPEGYK